MMELMSAFTNHEIHNPMMWMITGIHSSKIGIALISKDVPFPERTYILRNVSKPKPVPKLVTYVSITKSFLFENIRNSVAYILFLRKI